MKKSHSDNLRLK